MQTYRDGEGFLGLTGDLCNLEKAKIVVVPFEFCTSGLYRFFAPDKLVESSHNVSPYGDDLVSGNFFNIGVATAWEESPDCGTPIETVAGRLAASVREVVSLGKVPVVFGGSRAVAAVTIQVLKEKFDSIVVLSFDAHCNLEVFNGYSAVSAMSGCAQHAEQVIIAGVRHISPFERELLLSEDKTKIRCYRIRKHVRRLDGGIRTLIRTLEYWLKNKNVYITFDPDVLSSDIIRDAVPRPEPDGFTYDEVLMIFERLLPNISVVGADFSGLEPKSHNELEVYMIAKLISRFIANLKI